MTSVTVHRPFHRLRVRSPVSLAVFGVAAAASVAAFLSRSGSALAGATLGERPEGWIVVEVVPGSPAHRTGLVAGDVLAAPFDGPPGAYLASSPDGRLLEIFDYGFDAGDSLRLGIALAVTVAVMAVTVWGGRRPLVEIGAAGLIVAAILGPVWGVPAAILGGLVAIASGESLLSMRRLRLGAMLGVLGLVGTIVALARPAVVPWAIMPVVVGLTGLLPGAGRIGVRVGDAWRRAAPEGGGLLRIRAVGAELDPLASSSRAVAADNERTRLASDLHANVLPELERAIAIARARSESDVSHERLEVVVGELRAIVTDRYLPIVEDLGLVAALEWAAEGIEERSTLIVELEPRVVATPPQAVERAAFRIAQLALDNVVMHAQASTIRIQLDAGAEHLQLVIEDDGVGISPIEAGTARRRGRLGVADIERRALAVGGHARIGPGQGHGTRVSFRWPA
jgi:signal transduction histidine kinase